MAFEQKVAATTGVSNNKVELSGGTRTLTNGALTAEEARIILEQNLGKKTTLPDGTEISISTRKVSGRFASYPDVYVMSLTKNGKTENFYYNQDGTFRGKDIGRTTSFGRLSVSNVGRDKSDHYLSLL
jgi:hypothetical protein